MADPPVAYRSASQSQAALLTKNFYDWEYRTRGYLTWPYPVSPEPPFQPFRGHYIPPAQVIDDGRKPTFLSSIADAFRNSVSPNPEESTANYYEEESEDLPDLYVPEGEICELQIVLPPSYECKKRLADQFLQSLSYSRFPICFELIGTADQIWVQLAVRQRDRPEILTQLEAYLPEAVITQEQGLFSVPWEDPRNDQTVVVDFGLDQESMLPLERTDRFDVDPLIGIIGALSLCQETDIGIFQVIFLPARCPWADSLQFAALDWNGKPFLADAPELAKSVRSKIEKPLYGAVVRVGAKSSSRQRANSIVKSLGGALVQFNSPGSNSLIPLHNKDYPDEIHAQNVVGRLTNRSGILLNLDELINFVHFPSSSIRSAKFLRNAKKTKAAPGLSENHQLLLGENAHHGRIKNVSLSSEQRLRHMYVVGASGTGKSTLLLNLIIQDIQNGHGIAVLDPHGDLIDQIMDFIPPQRLDDVVLFDPTDEEYPIGFNIFGAHSETEKTLLASDLVGVFRRLSTSWGDQMNSVLANGILAMLESNEGGTLMTLRRFLIEPDFRRKYLKTVRDQEIVYYWEKEFPLLTGKPQGPVLTRLDTFLRPKLIRYMVSQKQNRIDFGQVMNEKKIFLAKLSHGGIGEENSYLLGALIVAKIHQLALSRQAISQEKRQPFFLYIDEFQNFITPSMEGILSGARKYGLGLVLAHQELRQLESKDRDVASSVLSNPYTRICFRMGDHDAVKLAGGFSFFDAKDLQSLAIGQAVGRIEQAEYDFNLRTFPLPERNENAEARLAIVNRSREKYGTPKSQVIEMLEAENPPPAGEKNGESRVERVSEAQPNTVEQSPRNESPKDDARRKSTIPDQPTSGRGGVQHRYLQQLIKRLAEERGYKAEVELSVLGGTGIVDVSLRKENEKLACEISVTTSAAHELENIQKCLAAGYETVLVLSHEKSQLNKIRQLAVEVLDAGTHERIRYLSPEELIVFLDSKQTPKMEQQKTIRGYKVRVNYTAGEAAQQKQRQDAIAKLIVNSMKKMKS
ncbi:MAG: type IV secretion system DNA-binding domain-containing protein [Candidatus Moranbacteria bacterium]|nr:type IV secretion system DNA-binding domain-containing protein [Candidatus Moranbacteria bacterium]